MSQAVSPHTVSHTDAKYCLTDEDFSGDGLHKALNSHLAHELSREFESAIRRRFKRTKWKVATDGTSPWHKIPLVEVFPTAARNSFPFEEESFVLDFNIVPVTDIGKKKNNSPVVQCRVLRYVDGKYMGAIHESVRSGAGTYNPDRWAYLAYIVVKVWVEQDTFHGLKEDDTKGTYSRGNP